MFRRMLLAALVAAFPAGAQPVFHAEREVRFLCGFAPGGTCDLLSRMLAEYLAPVVGNRVVVENRTGASGMIAAEAVARAAPDGHTVFLMPMALASVLPVTPGLRMPFDPDRDLTPIASVANVYNMLVVGPNSPHRTVAEILAAARARPGSITYASTGNGTSQHLAAEMLARAAGVQFLHVPFRGGAPAIVEMQAGRVDMMLGNMPEFLGQIRQGGLRAVAYGAARASPLMPDVPLIAATIPGFAVTSWFGVAGPGGMPENVLAGWVAALHAVGRNPEFQRRMAENAMEIILDDPPRFRAIIAEDRARWAEVIRAANIRAE
jgi:tripartite-type tricarboxylate transporter receptor subunit TctC